MTLIFMDGFDAKDAQTKWVQQTNTSQTAPTWSASTRFGSGFCITFPTESFNVGPWFRIVKAFTPCAQVFIGAAVKTDIRSIQNYSVPFHPVLTDNAATSHIYLVATALGALQVWRGDCRVIGGSGGSSGSTYVPSGTMIATTANGVIDANWHYVELGATINSATGTAVVKLDGTQVISFTGNTRNGGTSTNIDATMYTSFGLYNGGGSNPIGATVVDDLYICNALGSVNNTFLGDCRVQTLLPTGAGSATGLTPTGFGSNYQNVNAVPDNAGTYNGSAVTGTRDTYALSDVVAGTSQVFGVQQVMTSFKTDAGVALLKAAQKSGATLSYGATRTLGTAALVYADVFESNPATSVAYTASEVNALEAGVEVA